VMLDDRLWLSTPRGVGFAHLSTLLSDWRPAVAGLSSTEVDALASDDATLFALAADTGYRSDAGAGTWVATTGAGTVEHRVDDRGFVFATGPGGVFRWNSVGLAWAVVPGAPAPAASGQRDPEPTIDPDDVIFAATSLGLYEQTGGVWARYDFPP